MSTVGEKDPVVEAKASDQPIEVTRRALEHRIRQQEILAELGVTALQGAPLDQLLTETVRLTAEGLRSEFCKVMEYIPGENRLLVKAGVGWNPGIVGVASVEADLASPAGFALRTGKPVISNHLENEERFRTPEILAMHGIRRAMNVILQGDGSPFGVLEVDSQSEDEFVEHDLSFLQGAANILGMAIERERRERYLEAALERQLFLMKEVNHRVKNSLTIVVGMLNLQAREAGNPELTEKFAEAARRVMAVAQVHERLHQNPDIERVDLGTYVEAVCQDMDSSVARCTVHVDAQPGIEFPVDRAVSVALVVVELVTNAAKYAYPDHQGGPIWVGIKTASGGEIALSVRDEGRGLPADFELSNTRGLGMRIVTAFSTQLNTHITFHRNSSGTEFKMMIPAEPFHHKTL
jgi:two-component sensor histidine kinase